MSPSESEVSEVREDSGVTGRGSDAKGTCQVQYMAANVLVEAYATGMFLRVKHNLDWPTDRLNTPQGCMFISQVRWLVVYHLNTALGLTSICYTILGVALGMTVFYLFINPFANSFEPNV
ncbi:hypothetical protein PLEOSDRAFT_1081337 [Pleurotus ostreatus PC15]|uniref:Uncharacterized protein n=1 Tax=Pleurotus ostreatus (strain PC15) TaxID=1137138 RepID=A0A067NVQ8_PLEO1|nr:hypothetical protein PLEOSDRAFT_1081337 [Pleurotus ostreatus PC15]